MIRIIICLAFVLVTGISQSQNYKRIKVGLTTSVNLIFPSKILDKDLGLGVMIDENGNEIRDVLLEQPTENRLKLAAGVEGFETTNLFVETEGGYHTFLIEYVEFPKMLTYSINAKDAQVIKGVNKTERDKVRKKIKKKSLQDDLVSKIKLDKNLSPLDAIKSDLGLHFAIEQTYIRDTSMYIKLTLFNESNIQFGISYIGLSIREKTKGSKRVGVIQNIPKDIYRMYDITNVSTQIGEDFPIVHPQKEVQILLCVDKFTIDKKKILELEIWESEGERKEVLSITPKQLIRSKIL
jgi:hypothetical protein